MARFCTVSDIAAFLQVSIAEDNVSAMAAIEEVSAAIQNYCHQQIEEVVDDVLAIDNPGKHCRGGTRVFLPELPVGAVASVLEALKPLWSANISEAGQNAVLAARLFDGSSLFRFSAFLYRKEDVEAVIGRYLGNIRSSRSYPELFSSRLISNGG